MRIMETVIKINLRSNLEFVFLQEEISLFSLKVKTLSYMTF